MIAKLTVCAGLLLLAPEGTPQNEGQPPQATQPEPNPSAEPDQPVAPSAGEASAEPSPAESEPTQPAVDAETPEATATAAESSEDDLLEIEKNIIAHTNAERARYGLPPLEPDNRLMSTARRHCAWMASRRNMVHGRYGVAENIAMGQPHSQSVVRSWMNSSGHRANILNRGHRKIGVAAYRAASGVIFWCQQFRR